MIEINEVDYHECHEKITNVLKKGNHILCIVYNNFINNGIEINVVGYIPNASHPYVTEKGCYQFAVPKELRRRMKPVETVISMLVMRDFSINSKQEWTSKKYDFIFHPELWQYCGKELPNKYILPEYLLEKDHIK